MAESLQSYQQEMSLIEDEKDITTHRGIFFSFFSDSKF